MALQRISTSFHVFAVLINKCGSIPSKGKDFFPKRPDQLGCPTSLLFMGTGALSLCRER
jgi:hypothetical protein